MGLSLQEECAFEDSSRGSCESEIMEQKGWLFWVLWSPSLLSFIYAISVHFFLAGWHERKWTFGVSHLMKNLMWFALTSIVLIFIDGYQIPLILIGVLNWIGSIRFINETHEEQVQGLKPTFEVKNSLEGKVYLITGANAGIGKETAIQLWEQGATIILACRSKKRVEEAGFDVSSPNSRYLFLPCDLSSLSSVRKAVDILKDTLKTDKLHGLINNAGVMLGTQSFTKEGHFDTMMACNHIGHFLLTQLLLPTFLSHKEDPRIIILTSCTYSLASKGMNWEDLFCNQNIVKYTLFGQYAQTKLANILFGQELARRYSSMRVSLVHPGLVRTNVTSNMPWYLRYPNTAFSFILMVLQKTPPAGAYTSVYCATSPDIPTNGEALYYVNSQPQPILHPLTHTPEVCLFTKVYQCIFKHFFVQVYSSYC